MPLPNVPCDPEEVALLQYTGGTTGISKGAMLTHRNLIANVLQSVTWDRHAQKGRERMLTVLPFFHTYGITSCINASIYQAATIILLSRFEVNEVLDAIDRYQPTRMAGVPTMYIALANHPRIRESGISSIKVFSCGSAPFPMEAFKNFEELTAGKISEGYGLTEASPLAIANPPFGRRKVGSIGIPRPATDARIVDLETGEKTLPPGEEGELCLRGPQVMKGYWNRPEETAQTLRGGLSAEGRRPHGGGFAYLRAGQLQPGDVRLQLQPGVRTRPAPHDLQRLDRQAGVTKALKVGFQVVAQSLDDPLRQVAPGGVQGQAVEESPGIRVENRVAEPREMGNQQQLPRPSAVQVL